MTLGLTKYPVVALSDNVMTDKTAHVSDETREETCCRPASIYQTLIAVIVEGDNGETKRRIARRLLAFRGIDGRGRESTVRIPSWCF